MLTSAVEYNNKLTYVYSSKNKEKWNQNVENISINGHEKRI